MNRIEAYMKCHEIMLTNDDYTAFEAEGVTYILAQIADRGEGLAIQIYLVNPAVPENGNIQTFVDMPDDQQTALLSLHDVSHAIRNAHQKLNALKREADKDNPDETIERLKDMFRRFKPR